MKRKRILLAAAVVSCFSAANATAFTPMRANGVDMGRAGSLAENSHVTVTVALNLSNREELEQLVQAKRSGYTRGNPSYQSVFDTAAGFGQRFGPSAATISAVTGSTFRRLG